MSFARVAWVRFKADSSQETLTRGLLWLTRPSNSLQLGAAVQTDIVSRGVYDSIRPRITPVRKTTLRKNNNQLIKAFRIHLIGRRKDKIQSVVLQIEVTF